MMKRQTIGKWLRVCGVSAMTVLLAACSNDEHPGQGTELPEGKYPLELNTGGLVVMTPASTGLRSTVDNDWEDVSQVSVQVGNEVKTYKATPSSDNTTATLTSDDPFYWKNTDETKEITAWYPANETYPDQWTVQADQSGTGYQASDLIKGMLSLSYADKDNQAKNRIAFTHQTAKLKVVLIKGENFTEDSWADALSKAEVNILNRQYVSDGTTITPHVENGDFVALLAQQTVGTDESLFEVTVGGTDFTYTPSEAINLEGGKMYTYQVTVNREEMKVSGEISDWDDGDSKEVSTPRTIDAEPGAKDVQQFTLQNGDVLNINGDGEKHSGGFILNVADGATATVNLSNVKLEDNLGAVSAFSVQSANGGTGTVILNLHGENTISKYDSGISSGNDIHIKGVENGSLRITGDNAGGINVYEDANITIEDAAIKIDFKAINLAAAIGGANCGDITIVRSDISINVEVGRPEDSFNGGYGAAIGAAGQGGRCGNIDITLKEGQSKQDFLNGITVKAGDTTLPDENKIGKGLNGKSSGTVTWRDSAGNPL